MKTKKQKWRTEKMKNCFKNYHNQNQIVLELLFLPVTLLIKLVKLLVKTKKQRHDRNSHQETK